jgi:hypothetical protein
MTETDPETEEADRLRREFEEVGRSPLSWVISGNALLSAADLAYARYLRASELRNQLQIRWPATDPTAAARPLSPEEVALLPDSQLGPVAIMLVGLALENLAKAILIGAEPGLVQGVTGILAPIKSHSLEDLIRRADVVSSKEELIALQIVERFVVWAGRYPVPTQAVLPRLARMTGGRWARHQLAPITLLWDQATRVRERLAARLMGDYPGLSIRPPSAR